MVLPPLPHHPPLWLQFFILLDFWEFFVSLAVSIGDIASTIVSFVSDAFSATWNALKPIFGDVWGSLKPIWTDVLKPFYGDMKEFFQELPYWWCDGVGIVKDFNKYVHQWEKKIWDLSFGPVFDSITDVQKFLALTHLSNTKIGQAVNNTLNDIKNDLSSSYNFVVTPINQTLQVLYDYVLDFNGFIKAPLLFQSLVNDWDQIWSYWWTSGLEDLSPDGSDLLKHYGTRRPATHAADAFTRWSQNPPAPSAFRSLGAAAATPLPTFDDIDGDMLDRALDTFQTLAAGQTPDWWTTGEPHEISG